MMMKKAIYDSKSLFSLILGVIFGFSGFVLATPGDMDGDGYANVIDLSLFAEQWLADDCTSPDWCDGADINHSGNVDFNDFAFFAQNWSTAMPIWSDEFDGTTVDTSKWTILSEADGGDCWYRPENVAVSDGTLKIYNKEELYGGRHWTGGHIDATYYHPQYKYLVARIKHSAADTYIWATWWTVGWQGGTWKWPPEMDICEFSGGGSNKSPGQWYHWDYAGSGHQYAGNASEKNETEWHTYGAYWTADDACLFYVDGVLSSAPVGPAEGNLMAAKLKLTSSPNSMNRYSGCPLGTMEVDYVRVYDLPPVQTATQHLALNKPVTTSSAKNSGGAAKRAVDESSSVTRWESNWSDPQWIRVDLQATCSITQVKLNWQHAAGKNYKIQVADSPSGPWTDCISITNNYTTGWLTHNFAAKTGRYIQLLGTARTTTYGYSLYDMQVY
jgi:beta-glucanase (GH16 family)